MGKWTKLAAGAVGAVGAGAGIALARHRRRPARPEAAPSPNPEGSYAAPPPPLPEDPQAALDAARQRLRDRADALRRDIEGAGGPAGDA
jgi:hypothetical protein